MQRLLEKRLVIVAGKGGVGKTTCSAAIALGFARSGRRTLLVTVDPAKRLEDSLGVPVGATETPVQPNLAAMMLDPEAVVREHLLRELPETRITEHPMFRYVTNYMPGLNELMAIGKLNDLRRAGRYDSIVVDTAPTGHALSFLSVPKAMEELMSERSLLRWAIRGYAVWQRLSATARSAQNLFRKKEERQEAPPDIDFERVFGDIQAEAQRIRAFLTDPKEAGLVLVTIPERLPVEETCDLHAALTGDLGMTVAALVANKVQPDALRGLEERFDRIAGSPEARRRFTEATARATGEPPELAEALVAAAAFGELRRAMNLAHLQELAVRLPGIPLIEVPLFQGDVQGLQRLGEFRDVLFGGAPVRGPGSG